MRKFHTPLVSKGKKLADLKKSFSPKPKQDDVVSTPKITSVTIIKTINQNSSSNLSLVEGTLIEISGLPEGKDSFDLVVVMSPTQSQPPQYPPFQKSYRLTANKDGKATLEGGPLSFSGGLEPPNGDHQYQLNLVQDINSGEVWDIEDAEVIILDESSTSKTSDLTGGGPLDDKKPKVAKVTVIKTINDDITVAQYHTVQLDIQDLPASVVPYSLKVTMTANSTSEPDQKAPRVAPFSLVAGSSSVIEGTLTFKASPTMIVQNNAYTLNSVVNQSDSMSWAILDNSIDVSDD